MRDFAIRHERLAMAIVLGVGLVVRLPMLPVDPRPVPDVQLFIDWARIARDHGLVAVSDSIPDRYNLYPPLAIWLLRGLATLEGALPEDLRRGDTFLILLIKALPVVAELAMAYLIAMLVRSRGAVASLIGAAAIAWNPALIWLSTMWGQIDSVYVFLLVCATAALERGAVVRGWLVWAAAALIKVQGLLLGPLVLAASLRDVGWRRTLVGCVAAVGLAMLLFSPWISGGGERYLAALSLVQPRTTFSAMNTWYLVGLGRTWADTRPIWGPITPRLVGMAVTLALAGLVTVALWTRRERVGLALPAAILAMTPYMVLTGMRSRYLLAVIPFLVLLSLGWDRRGLVRHAGWMAVIVTTTLLFNLVAYVPPDVSWWLPFTSTKVGPPLQPVVRMAALGAAVANTLVFVGLLASLWQASRREPASNVGPETQGIADLA